MSEAAQRVEPAAGETPHPGFFARMAGYAADALRYWEPRRAIYNLVLAGITAAHYLTATAQGKERLTLNLVLFLFVLAVLANICYCAVYVIDLFVQFAGLRGAWQRGRLALLLIGTGFAGVITHFAMTLFP